MRIKHPIVLAFVLIAALTLGGCGNTDAQDTDSLPTVNPADKGSLTVVTSFYPMYIFTLNVTKDVPGIQVVNLTDPNTGDLHDYSLTPENMKTLEQADILIINGAGLEAFLDKALSQLPHLEIIDTSDGLELLAGDAHHHETEYAEADQDHASQPVDTHQEEVNPHVWVSLNNAMVQVKNIGDKLAQLDPEHRELYQKNTQEYLDQLERQKQKMLAALQPLTNRQIITFHNAFPYFARDFGLTIAGVVQSNPGSDPNAKEMAEIVNTVKQLNIKALFAEPQYPANAANIIANETGVSVYVLDPAVTGALHPEAYIEIMDRNLETLLEALK